MAPLQYSMFHTGETPQLLRLTKFLSQLFGIRTKNSKAFCFQKGSFCGIGEEKSKE